MLGQHYERILHYKGDIVLEHTEHHIFEGNNFDICLRAVVCVKESVVKLYELILVAEKCTENAVLLLSVDCLHSFAPFVERRLSRIESNQIKSNLSLNNPAIQYGRRM